MIMTMMMIACNAKNYNDDKRQHCSVALPGTSKGRGP